MINQYLRVLISYLYTLVRYQNAKRPALVHSQLINTHNEEGIKMSILECICVCRVNTVRVV